VLKDAFKSISMGTERATKRSFIVLVNAINNIYLPWMSFQEEGMANSQYVIMSEQECT